ncbi:MAG: TIGR00296 family protein [Halobacteria archaeon]|nr:TIGR00296 family protein [Halobacteria archaeon]
MAAQNSVLSHEKGKAAIELARESMESYVINGQREHPGSMEDVFYERTGVLIKLSSTRGRGSVRGSAGSYHRDKHFSEAIIDAVIEASDSSSGTSEIEESELRSISITLCALDSIDEVADPETDVEVGRHGLIVETSDESGWMLPTMPVEHGWSSAEFLDRVCCKAGSCNNGQMGRGSWKQDNVSVYTFEGAVFRERSPGGDVEEVSFS